MSDENDKISQFIAVTGVNEERARFYLESSSWTLEMALTSFYDADADNTSDVEIVEHPPDTEQSTQDPQTEASSKSKPKKPNAKFATIHTINSSSEDEEEGQAFYAGGSEHSGQQVLGPKKKDIISDMFKSVKEHGVEVLDNMSPGSSRAFRGTGYKLGQTEDDTETVPGAPEPSKPVQATLKLWKDGFSVDDGELRLYSDPGNQEFLNSVRRGEIPHELRRGYSEVHVSMEDHRMENFTQTLDNKNRRAFMGQGHTLGSPAPATVGCPKVEDQNVNEAHAKENLKLDNEQPITNLQIRLADGSRLVGRFNHNHTVQQIRTYIIAARPQYGTREFALLSSFPPRELEDSQTLADAGILNAAIIQKLT